MINNEELIKHPGIRDLPEFEVMKNAFLLADKKLFVRPESHCKAYEDRPLSIGFSQTISQPYTVLFMLKLLDVCQ